MIDNTNSSKLLSGIFAGHNVQNENAGDSILFPLEPTTLAPEILDQLVEDAIQKRYASMQEKLSEPS